MNQKRLRFAARSLALIAAIVLGAVTVLNEPAPATCTPIEIARPAKNAGLPLAANAAVPAAERAARKESRLFAAYHSRFGEADCCLDIAHAGGSYFGQALTNSKEALDRNYSLGRRVFEVDLIPTCDGEIVLAHDWSDREGVPPSSSEFLAGGTKHGLSAMDLRDLILWMRAHDEAIVVTDTKFNGGPEILLRHLRTLVDDKFLRDRFVFQLYSPQEVENEQFRSFQRVLTIYRMRQLGDEEVVQLIRRSTIAALTIPADRAERSLKGLREALSEIPIYVHGQIEKINNLEYQAHFATLGASGFYQE